MNVLSLPSAAEAEIWAKEVVGRDSTTPWTNQPMSIGDKPTLAIEVNLEGRQNWMNRSAIRKIEITIWPSVDFIVVFEQPDRHWQTDVRGRHEFYLDRPFTVPVMVRYEGVAVMDDDYPKYTLLNADPRHAEQWYAQLEPDYQGLTREETIKLGNDLGLEIKEFRRYSTNGKPDRFFGSATALQLPEQTEVV